MNTPLFLGVILGVVVMTLPGRSPGISEVLRFAVITLSFFLPFAFSKKITASASEFFENHHPIGKKILSVHGIIFLSLVQPFALLWAIDYFLPPFFGEVHNTALIGITVIGGLIAIAAGPSFVLTVSRMVSSMLFAGVLLVIVNAAVFRFPLFTFITPDLFRNADSHIQNSILSVHSLASVAALSIIIFWLTWLELSEVDRKNGMKKLPMFSMTGIIIFAAGICVIGISAFFNGSGETGSVSNAAGLLISTGVVAGLIGSFVVTASSVGSLFANRLYPEFGGSADREKKVLVNKLAIVFSVIVAVLLIPIERTIGGTVIVWYIGFLAVFTGPIVSAFIISMAVKKQHPFVLSLSVVLGGFSALLGFVLDSVLVPGMMDGTGMFSVSILGASVTAASYAVLGAMKELVVVQRMLSRMDHP